MLFWLHFMITAFLADCIISGCNYACKTHALITSKLKNVLPFLSLSLIALARPMINYTRCSNALLDATTSWLSAIMTRSITLCKTSLFLHRHHQSARVQRVERIFLLMMISIPFYSCAPRSCTVNKQMCRNHSLSRFLSDWAKQLPAKVLGTLFAFHKCRYRYPFDRFCIIGSVRRRTFRFPALTFRLF